MAGARRILRSARFARTKRPLLALDTCGSEFLHKDLFEHEIPLRFEHFKWLNKVGIEFVAIDFVGFGTHVLVPTFLFERAVQEKDLKGVIEFCWKLNEPKKMIPIPQPFGFRRLPEVISVHFEGGIYLRNGSLETAWSKRARCSQTKFASLAQRFLPAVRLEILVPVLEHLGRVDKEIRGRVANIVEDATETVPWGCHVRV